MRNWFYEQMAMYSAYHRDGRNQATHHVGVPLIVFSLMLLLSRVTVWDFGAAGPLSLGAVLIGCLLLVYVFAVPLVGTIAVLIYGGLLWLAESLAFSLPGNSLYIWFAGFFIGGWIIQFIGHGFEGRKPALFDNLLQIFMAPAFLIAELLFLAGFEAGLKTEIHQRMPRYLPNTDKSA